MTPTQITFVVLAMGCLAWLLKGRLADWFKREVKAAFSKSSAEFLDLASERLKLERQEDTQQLALKEQGVRTLVEGLEEQLKRYEKLVNDFERDRTRKYGSLEAQLTHTAAQTRRLELSTNQLTSMLGNRHARGQWGEKAADDILRMCGLQDGIHYKKQENAPTGRPDFTILLPDSHKCYMDVKFPLNNYLRWTREEDEDRRKVLKTDFITDVKRHLTDLERREYATADTQSTDYIVMFVASESIHGILHEWWPGLMDEALKKRILICGPWSLYAIIRIIWQAWEHYYQVQTHTEILGAIREFQRFFKIFRDRFSSLGTKLEEATALYEDIERKSYSQLTKRISKIEELQSGKNGESPQQETEVSSATLTKGTEHD